MRQANRSAARSGLALVLCLQLGLSGCELLSQPLPPAPGLPQYQAASLVDVPGGWVNAAGGNLILRRSYLSLDTPVGAHALWATYNSASGAWHWNFEMTYLDGRFVDDSGAVYDLSALADGAAVPGSVWVRVDGDTVAGRGNLEFHFDGQGRLERVAWATLAYPRIEYAYAAGAISVSQCAGAGACQANFAIAANAAGRPASITDLRTGRSADFAYDAAGMLALGRTAAEVENDRPGTRYEYDALDPTLLTASVNSEGERIEYDYQAGRRILHVTQIGDGDPRHRFEFYAASGESGMPLWAAVHINPAGGRTRYLFDALRRVWEIEREATGETTRLSWPGGQLRPASVTTAWGATTGFAYQGDDLESVTEPSGNVVVFEYEPGCLSFARPFARPLRRVEDSLGLVTTRAYDGACRPVAIGNGEGEASSLTWNGASLAGVVSPAGVETGFPVYGAHGHWLETSGAAEDRRAFDPVGNALVSSVLLRPGGLLSRSFDADRRVAALRVAASEGSAIASEADVVLTRRSDGRVLRIERPFAGDHELVYDAIGRHVETRERVDGSWQVTRIERDALGLPVAVERPNGMRSETPRDTYGRVTAIRSVRGGVLEGEVSFTYQDGLLASKSDTFRGTTVQYAYDAAGRLVTALFGYGEALHLSWDLRSRPVSQRFSIPGLGDVAIVATSYDLANRVATLTDALAQELLLARSYDNGRLAARTFGNGLTRSFAYDAVTGLPLGAETRDATGALVAETVVAASAETGPARQQLRAEVTTPLASTVEEYWLGLGASLGVPEQLVGKRVFHWNDGAGTGRDFDYDALGSREGCSYNAERNRLTSCDWVAYEWDEAGFASARDGVPLVWRGDGRLLAHGGDEFEWDGLGGPISARVGGALRRFDLFDGLLESDVQAGSLGTLALAAEVSLDVGSGVRSYRHFDFRSNVSFVSDDAGAIVAHYRYGPYGRDAAFGPGADGVTFAGRQEVGALALMGARIYDAAAGRFLSPDPRLQLRNQYAWTLGNPVLFADASGLQASVSSSWGAQAGAFSDFGIRAIAVGGALATASALAPPLAPIAIAVLSGGFAALTVAAVIGGVAEITGHDPGPGGGPGPPPPPPPGPPSSGPRQDDGGAGGPGAEGLAPPDMNVQVTIEVLDVTITTTVPYPANHVGLPGGGGGGSSCGLLGIEAALALFAIFGWRTRARRCRWN